VRDKKPECMRFLTAASITQLFAVLESDLPAVPEEPSALMNAAPLYTARDIAQWLNERVDRQRAAMAQS
jgi:hypothetical protein